jgi:hypothetical protein
VGANEGYVIILGDFPRQSRPIKALGHVGGATWPRDSGGTIRVLFT